MRLPPEHNIPKMADHNFFFSQFNPHKERKSPKSNCDSFWLRLPMILPFSLRRHFRACSERTFMIWKAAWQDPGLQLCFPASLTLIREPKEHVMSVFLCPRHPVLLLPVLGPAKLTSKDRVKPALPLVFGLGLCWGHWQGSEGRVGGREGTSSPRFFLAGLDGICQWLAPSLSWGSSPVTTLL